MRFFSGLAVTTGLALAGCMGVPMRTEPMTRVSGAGITRDSPYWKQGQRFAGRDPVEEAGRAFNKKRYAIYSASGRALFYPGLDYGLGRLIALRFGATPLPGFSQSPTSRDQLAYMRLAEQYAAAYNREMRRLLTEAGLLPG